MRLGAMVRLWNDAEKNAFSIHLGLAIWAPIAAELLAAQLSGEPLPIEGDLVDALDPARFLLRTQRRSLGDAAATDALQNDFL